MVLRKNDILIICGLTLIAFAIRFILLTNEKMLVTDAVQYLTLGKNIMLGNGYVSDGSHYPDIIRLPLHPILIGLSHLVFKDLEFAGRLITILLGSLSVILVFAISKEFFGRIPAILSSIGVILHPVLTHISVSACTDATFILFFTAAIFIGWLSIYRKARSVYFLLTGILLGLSYLSKQIGIMFFCVYFLFAILALRWRNSSTRYISKSVGILLIGFLILFIPYMAWVRNYSGVWMEPGFTFNKAQVQWEGEVIRRQKEDRLAGKGLPEAVRIFEAVQHGLSDDGKEIMLWEKMEELERSGKAFGLSRQMVRNISYNLYSLINVGIPSIFPTFFFFFMTFGVIGKEWSNNILKKHIYLASMFLVNISFVLLGHLETRYLAPSIVIGSIWAGNGVVTFSEFLRDNIKKGLNKKNASILNKHFFIIIFMLLLVASLLPGIYRTHFRDQDEPIEHKKAGYWLRDNRPSSVIMSRKPQISFYAEGKYVVLPFASYRDIMEFAKLKNVNIIVVDERYVPNTRPELINLLKETQVPNEAKLIYKDEEIKGSKLLLYEIEHNRKE